MAHLVTSLQFWDKSPISLNFERVGEDFHEKSIISCIPN